MTWYETVRHNTFDFHKEMELYCDRGTFRTKDNHVVLKAKGVTQNYENAPRVNLESITRLVEGFINDRNSDLEILSSYKKIVRDEIYVMPHLLKDSG